MTPGSVGTAESVELGFAPLAFVAMDAQVTWKQIEGTHRIVLSSLVLLFLTHLLTRPWS